MPRSPSFDWSTQRPSTPEDNHGTRVISFPSPSHSPAALEPDSVSGGNVNHRREARRRAPARRFRRRSQSTPWLQRNALSVAGLSLLVAFAGFGFGLLQLLNRSEPAPAMAPLATVLPATTAATTVPAPGVSGPGGASQPTAAATSSMRQVKSSVRVLEPTYTVVAGDTLARLAARFNTSVERIQALNNLADPQRLSIGTKLVIPPPF
jgi:LysM repeat protein